MRHRNLVTAPIKALFEKGTKEFNEKNFTLNAHFDFNLKLCAAVISRGPMAKFLLWFICIHDFESYPFDRELSYDFA